MPTKSKSSASSQAAYGKTGRQKKVKKEGPKKALTAYMLFSMARREQIVSEKPELRSNVTEMSKIIGAEWRQMSAEEKAPYQREHELAKERYLQEKRKFDENGSLSKSDAATFESKDDDEGNHDFSEEEEDDCHDETEEDSHEQKLENPQRKSEIQQSTPLDLHSKTSDEQNFNMPSKRQRKDTNSPNKSPSEASSPNISDTLSNKNAEDVSSNDELEDEESQDGSEYEEEIEE